MRPIVVGLFMATAVTLVVGCGSSSATIPTGISNENKGELAPEPPKLPPPPGKQ